MKLLNEQESVKTVILKKLDEKPFEVGGDSTYDNQRSTLEKKEGE